MSLHPLLSDWFLYGITALFLFFLCRRINTPAFKKTLQQLTSKPAAVFSLLILLLFFLVALTDSVHFRVNAAQRSAGQPAIQSLLDQLAPRLAFAHENTYSKPLNQQHAVPSYAQDQRGNIVFKLSALKHISANANHSHFLLKTLLVGATYGLAAFIGLLLLITTINSLINNKSFVNSTRQCLGKNSLFAWRSFFMTLLVMSVLIGIALNAASHFHLLGTNKIGGDVWYESLKSIRTAIIVGTLSTVSMLPFALLLGLISGYFRGWVDDVIQYIYTTLSSIPGVLLISASILLMQITIHNHPTLFPTLQDQADARLVTLCLILGLTSWANLCRLLRAETLKVKSYDFVQVAKVMKVRKLTLLKRHILPNILHLVLITVALDFSALVLAEAVLSYIGVGVDPTTPSFGNIINSARLEMAREPTIWWTLAAAIGLLFLLVLAANLFADALRDTLDPSTTHSVDSTARENA